MALDNDFDQKREHPRINTCIPVIINAYSSSFKGMILNLSSGGAHCMLEEFLPLKTKIVITFKLPISQFDIPQIRLKANVVRIDHSTKTNAYDNYKFAVQFIEAPPNVTKIIDDYIAEKKKTDDNQIKDLMKDK